MKALLKEILFIFCIVVFANIIVDLGEEEQRFLVKPVKFFGLAVLLSTVGGLLMYWIKNRKSETKND